MTPRAIALKVMKIAQQAEQAGHRDIEILLNLVTFAVATDFSGEAARVLAEAIHASKTTVEFDPTRLN